MGAVYSAVQPVIGKRVAIKVIAPHIASNPEVVRRFVAEARAVNTIGHPNIVDIFSFGWLPDQRHYFAMEFLDGKSLSDRASSTATSIPTTSGSPSPSTATRSPSCSTSASPS
jgi:serine/threonine-protein kinase